MFSFFGKQFRRQHLNAHTLHALAELKDTSSETILGTFVEYYRGLWNFSLSILEVAFCWRRFEERNWYHSNRKVSLIRETSYEFIWVVMFSLPYIFALIIRIETNPFLQPTTGCTGCIVQWQDVVIASCIVTIYSLPVLNFVYQARTHKIPDPLNYLYDLTLTTVFSIPFSIAVAILLPVDPYHLMKSQKMDWHLIDCALWFSLAIYRTMLQIYRTTVMHRIGEQQIKLLDVLIDTNGKLAILFEKHLMAGKLSFF